MLFLKAFSVLNECAIAIESIRGVVALQLVMTQVKISRCQRTLYLVTRAQYTLRHTLFNCVYY